MASSIVLFNGFAHKRSELALHLQKTLHARSVFRQEHRRVEHASVEEQLQHSKFNTCWGAANVPVGRGTGRRIWLAGPAFQPKSVGFISGGSEFSADVHKQA